MIEIYQTVEVVSEFGREALLQQIPHLRSPVAEQLNFQVRPLAPQRRHIGHHAVAQAEDISLRHAAITDGISANAILVMQRHRAAIGHTKIAFHRPLGRTLFRPPGRSPPGFLHRHTDPVERHTHRRYLRGHFHGIDQSILDILVIRHRQGTYQVRDPLETRARIRQSSQLLRRRLRFPRRALLYRIAHRPRRPRQPPVPHHSRAQAYRIHYPALSLSPSRSRLPVQRSLHRYRTDHRVVRPFTPSHSRVPNPADHHGGNIYV